MGDWGCPDDVLEIKSQLQEQRESTWVDPKFSVLVPPSIQQL